MASLGSHFLLSSAWRIEAIQGCTYSPYLSNAWGSTLGCNTEGGQTVTLLGDWSDQQDSSKVEVAFVDKMVEGAVKCGEVWIGVPGAEGSTRTTKCVKEQLPCTNVAVLSTSQVCLCKVMLVL